MKFVYAKAEDVVSAHPVQIHPHGIAGQVRNTSRSRYLAKSLEAKYSSSYRRLLIVRERGFRTVIGFLGHNGTCECLEIGKGPEAEDDAVFVGPFELGTIKAGIETGFAPICPTNLRQTRPLQDYHSYSLRVGSRTMPMTCALTVRLTRLTQFLVILEL